jgi:hypothetical protein
MHLDTVTEIGKDADKDMDTDKNMDTDEWKQIF